MRSPATRKATALLAYLAAEGAAPRQDLAMMLWGHGRLQNLRQELHVLRSLPAVSTWLFADRREVRVEATSDLAALRSAPQTGDDPSKWWRGPFCEGLDRIAPPRSRIGC